MSLTARVLVGLVAGLLAGLAIASSASVLVQRIPAFVEPIGTLWINAIRMTVVPLVVSSLIVGVARAPDASTLGRIGGRALLLFVSILLAASLLAVIVGAPLMERLIDPAAATALRAGSLGTVPVAPPGFAQWLVELVPSNPVKAAADGAMLPLIIFSIAFGLALLRLPLERRERVVGLFDGVMAAMLMLVRWVLALAPIGVFALSLALATKLGLRAAGAIAAYVVIVSLTSALFAMLVLYPAAVLLGRVGLARFARGIGAAQAVAFSSRSSMAALPAMIEGASSRLGLPVAITTFFLPLAASVFRAGAGVGLTIGVLFTARLYGVSLGAAQLATVILTVVLTSFSIPGIPGGSIIAMVPVMQAAGIPIEGVGILLGIDTIPDMFRTTVNVTGSMTAAVIVGRSGGVERVDSGEPLRT
ncbi:MAG: dicarboxylate/amino acid:cation symporter [Gemmatimonadota bacterium]|nr:dicarboxylate/amino acid:cation symporter [Gemmatimonadota bacterium]